MQFQLSCGRGDQRCGVVNNDLAVASDGWRECRFSESRGRGDQRCGVVNNDLSVGSDGGRECRFSGRVAAVTSDVGK